MKIKTKIGFLALVFVFLASPVLAELFSGSGVGPTASFIVSPSVAITGNPIVFDASASRNSIGSMSGLRYRWDFEGNYAWTSWSSTAKMKHTFTEAKDYTARLQVKDADGLIDETAFKVFVGIKYMSSSPLARIYVDPASGDTTTNFHFKVSVFSNIGTPTDQLEVRWDWNHDGTWDTTWSKARDFFHVFPDALNQEVWLQVRDTDGSSSIEKGIYVEGKEDDTIRNKEIGLIHLSEVTAPLASFTTSATSVDQGATVLFDATPSIRAAEFRWDFDGDGRFENSWNAANQKVQRVYKNVGVFAATLEVRSAAGEIGKTTRTITVIDKSNILPTVSFTLYNSTNSSLGSALAILSDKVKFTATVRDEDGMASKAQVRWDFDGDGTWDTTFSLTKTATYQFTATGTKFPRLQVRDELGALATVTGQIEIAANTAPRASFKVSPDSGAPGATFRFDAADSRDDQSGTSNLQYRFDFDGDGIFDTEFSGTSAYSKKIGRTGNLTATVEVRDRANATGRATANFAVIAPIAPIAGFVVEPRVGTFATNFEFDASASRDPAGSKLNYRWDLDYRGENDIDFSSGWSTSPIFRYRFSTVGNHSIRLVVRNAAGLQDDVFGKIKIHAESLSLQFLRQKGIIANEENPDGLITRAELAQIIVKATKIPALAPRIAQFTDVPASDVNARYIAAVSARGWISPRNNFAWQPNGSVNRAEAAKIVIAALYPRVATKNGLMFFDVPESAWYARFAETAAAQNLIATEDHRFNPALPVTRAEVVRMVAVLLDRYHSTRISARSSTPVAQEFFTKILAKLGLTD